MFYFTKEFSKILKQFYLIVITFISYVYVYKTKQKEFLFQWQLVNYVIKGPGPYLSTLRQYVVRNFFLSKSQNYESLLVSQCVEREKKGVIEPF